MPEINKTYALGALLVLVIILLLVWVFWPVEEDDVSGMMTADTSNDVVYPDEDELGYSMYNENFNPNVKGDSLQYLGYDENIPYDEMLKHTELEPSIHASNAQYVKDVRKFSIGPSFSTVVDDNVSDYQVGFIGLRRPQAVRIGKTARQQPEAEEHILQKNKNVYRF